jgi:hypothetical protein
MRRFGEGILSYRAFIVIAILALTGLFLSHLSSLNIEADENTWFAKGDNTLKVYDEFIDLCVEIDRRKLLHDLDLTITHTSQILEYIQTDEGD